MPGDPHDRGLLGTNVERAQRVTNDGLTFGIIRLKGTRFGSPGTGVISAADPGIKTRRPVWS